jgi:hypothetical protein
MALQEVVEGGALLRRRGGSRRLGRTHVSAMGGQHAEGRGPAVALALVLDEYPGEVLWTAVAYVKARSPVRE